MRYIGSKISTIDAIFELVSEDMPSGSFCDPFGGTATVSSYFKLKGYKVFTGDVLEFAHCFQQAKLSYKKSPSFKKLKFFLGLRTNIEIISHFNKLISYRGWFIDNYSKRRKFFTLKNAGKIQACWYSIIRYYSLGLINEREKAFLLASLINSMDKVANTAGTYYAYLKKFDRKAKNLFVFELIRPTFGCYNGTCEKIDALELIKKEKYDIIYLDPPYNSRNYLNYYHLPETIARCTKPNVYGKSGVPKRTIELKSNFYNSKIAAQALKQIIENAQFNVLLFHYRDDGLIQPHVLKEVFSSFKSRKDIIINSLGYTTKSEKRESKNHIYIIKNVKNTTRNRGV